MRNGAVRSNHGSSNRRNSSQKESEGESERGEGKHAEGGDTLTLVSKRTATMRRVSDWRDALTHEAKTHPGRTAALALGAGYLLGGGLFSALTARLLGTGLRLGFRLALVPFVTQGLVSMGESLVRGGGLEMDDDGAAVGRDSERHQSSGSASSSDQKETHS